MDLPAIKQIVDEISYKDWTLWVSSKREMVFVYATFLDEGDIQQTRKWYIPPIMAKSEIVQTVLKCILTAEEHEARERFRYKGVKVFAPHFDVDRLVDFARFKENLSATSTVAT